ncbi:MATE family efflux transporter [Methylobacterium aerolatum]|uniref:MATE family efflux protein n=1 Tax=Methylobacterium aerolatum TaxID=418708 RepID=A0ABU0HWQ5_9HYPH|nr:MATE family efflux transporter [Methylobacterium aerolatum]MDQ0446248.1 putative MATE family efflux protein [Methylobacterium aerolatum]GJD35591.1 Multidrug export protein MepA [Methylobacterium aerolatum]
MTDLPGHPEGPVPEDQGRFVTGPVLRHVLVMSATGSVGLMAIFVVDLLSLLYVSRLGDPALTAAVGLASVVQFFATAVNIGLMIAAGALVARAVGARDRVLARRLSASAMALGVLVAGLLSAAMLPFAKPMLAAIGAKDEALAVADLFLRITLPSNALLALGMLFTGLLRAIGEAGRAMWVTLGGAIVTAFLDPLLIFAAGLGVEGAAITVCVARATFVAIGWYGLRRHGMLRRPRLREVVEDAPAMAAIAGPAVATNLAPSVASAFLTHLFAGYGPDAIAAAAVIDRLTPVAFGGLFALSGAVGPILAQNWGASRFDRMGATLSACVRTVLIYAAVVWLGLILLRSELAALFQLKGLAAELFTFFCLVGGAMWFFNGLLFLGNAAFNNLGFPLRSTLLNWGRATVGTVPPAYLGSALYGPKGILIGMGVGSLVFGLAGVVLARRTVSRLADRAAGHGAAATAEPFGSRPPGRGSPETGTGGKGSTGIVTRELAFPHGAGHDTRKG